MIYEFDTKDFEEVRENAFVVFSSIQFIFDAFRDYEITEALYFMDEFMPGLEMSDGLRKFIYITVFNLVKDKLHPDLKLRLQDFAIDSDSALLMLTANEQWQHGHSS